MGVGGFRLEKAQIPGRLAMQFAPSLDINVKYGLGCGARGGKVVRMTLPAVYMQISEEDIAQGFKFPDGFRGTGRGLCTYIFYAKVCMVRDASYTYYMGYIMENNE